MFQPSLVKIQTACIFFAAWEAVWLLELATLWILSIVTNNSVILTWSLWRIPDAFMIFVNLGVLALYTGSEKPYPAIIVAIFNAAAILADVAALATFAVQYASCISQITDGDTLTDPLCMTADLAKIGGYHLGIISIILVGVFANLYVPIMMFRLMTKETGEGLLHYLRSPGNSTVIIAKIRHLTLFNRAISIFAVCVGLMAMEVSILTGTSNIKYLWFCDILMIVPAVATIFANWGLYEKINKFVALVSILAFAGAAVGLSLMTWYYVWLCNTDPPITGFSNFTTCEIGRPGAIFMVTIHAVFVFVSLLRCIAEFYALMISSGISHSAEQTEEFVENASEEQLSMGSGTAYRRSRLVVNGKAIEIESSVSGGKIKV